MEEKRSSLRETLFGHRSIPLFRGISSFYQSRRPSDKFLLGLFALLLVVASLVSAYQLENSLLITEPAYGGTLTEGDVGSPRFINPILALSDTDQDLTALTYAGLMGYDAKGNLVPVLAQSYTISPDGKTYTFVIRAGAKFSDGTPVTANDILFTVHKAQDPALKSPQYANWSTVTAVAVDARTVQFTLPAPYTPFIDNATLGILPAHLWQGITDEEFPFSDLMVKPVGAGPFQTLSLSRDSNGGITAYTVSANPDYALGKPYLDAIRLVFYPDQASLQTAVAKNSVESAYGVTGPNVLTAPYARVFAVFFNTAQNPGLKDAAVRQALSVAVDRSGIISSILGGYATALTGPVPPTTVSAPSATTSPSELLTMAGTLLSRDGWTYSSSTTRWTDKSGNPLSVVLSTSNVPELSEIAHAIQSSWQMLGVPTTIQFYAPSDLSQSVITPRSFQALLFGMVIGKGDDLYDFWDSQESSSGLNITAYSNSSVDTLLQKLRTDTDPVVRDQDLVAINQAVGADYPAAFIESPDFVYVVPKDLKGVILPQITSPADRFATVATWYRRTESVWPFLARHSSGS